MTDLFSAIGHVKSVYTLVDFYQYIKTVEYLICVAFFVGFPMFYRYMMSASGSKTQEANH
jgi:formate-dependent phosphoribosylglycinamide formyltransferase (GAR transformylase)